MEDLYDPEELILCPYDSSHHIRRNRMSFHLVKCQKLHPEHKLAQCLFNITHMVPEPELPYHHQGCPDRKKLEPQIVESQLKSTPRFPIRKIVPATENQETWDNESVATYDPTKYTENNDILRQMDVESAAKRKIFRHNERQRLSSMPQTETAPPPARPIKEVKAKTLPPHRNISDLKQDTDFNAEKFKQKMKSSNKVFLQYKTEPEGSSKNN